MYGFIGNGETAALIAPDLSLSWLCLPRFDGVPVFAGALDPDRGGQLSLRLLDGNGRCVSLFPDGQRYRGDSAVLETTAFGGGWRVTAVDYMPWGLPCVVREVRVVNLTGADAEIRVHPRVVPVRSRAFPLDMLAADREVMVAASGAVLVVREETGPILVPAGESRMLRIHLGYGADETQARASVTAAAGATARAAEAFWASWMARARVPGTTIPGSWRSAYYRSLMVLKLLTCEESGAMIAAPTASFPAVPGGGDNWDYRYCWLRDGFYAAMTLDAVGLHRESRRFYDFVFERQGEDGYWPQPLYTVDGRAPAEFVAPDLAGPGGERPIRFGNAASGQLQLDNGGNILHGLWFHYKTSGDIGALQMHWEAVSRACRWTIRNWHRPESGIWEIREYEAHWVHGKAMCAAALWAGAQIAVQLGYPAQAREWASVADAIRAAVVEQGWNPARRAYLRHYGKDAPAPPVDISVLALVFHGLLSPLDPRVLSTVALMEKHQNEGGLRLLGGFCRYDYAAVPFYLPTLWLARYYLMAGRLDDCDRLIQTCLDSSTDLGLMAEHFDGERRVQWGNFPQSFSHEELARLILEREQGWSFQEWNQPSAGISGPAM